MQKLILIIIFGIAFISCKEKPKQEVLTNKTVKTEELVMYKMSEMALLMEKMFVENERLKEKIKNGEDLGNFNEEYLKIYTAVLTDPSDRNDTFNSFSKVMMVNQKAVYNSEGKDVKITFNTMVQTCISCHKTTCMGPIPRIKKLLIK